MAKKILIVLASLALAAFALSACGGDDEESSTTAAETTSETTEETGGGGSGGAGGTVAFEADPGGDLAYTETDVTATAGESTIQLDNQSTTPHNVVVDDVFETDVVSGDTATTDATLEPGEYTFYCSVDAHRDAGMEGTLTVE